VSAQPHILPEPGRAWRIELAAPGDDGVAVLTLDVPDSKVNVLSGVVLEELSTLLERLPHVGLRGLVVASGKPSGAFTSTRIGDPSVRLSRSRMPCSSAGHCAPSR